ncbi:MAG: glutathione S-transferase N-terminal domain-containing protein, partial [Gammaproteobacteria bacterium]
MNDKLLYFQIRGRGEQVRLLLYALELPFDDILIKRNQFLALTARGSATLFFYSFPMLEHDKFRLCRAPAILSYLAAKHGAAPSDPQLKCKPDVSARGAGNFACSTSRFLVDEWLLTVTSMQTRYETVMGAPEKMKAHAESRG